MSTDSLAASSPLDPAGPLRPGEPLDVAAIDAFLKARIPALSGELAVRQFPGGASNLTYLLSYCLLYTSRCV